MCYDRKGNYIPCYSHEFCSAEPPEDEDDAVSHDASWLWEADFESPEEHGAGGGDPDEGWE